jgi:multicomponent Na+:H+ antiporter subunit G
MNEIISNVFIGIGVAFDFFGCLGLIRLPDVYNRLQAATKSVTLGTWSILFGVFLRYGFTVVGVKALICIPLLYFAATVAAHALIRGSYIFGIKMWDKSVIDDYKNEWTQGR